jgi:hypothetical protein
MSYAKNEKSNLNAAEKKMLTKLAEKYHAQLSRRANHGKGQESTDENREGDEATQVQFASCKGAD